MFFILKHGFLKQQNIIWGNSVTRKKKKSWEFNGLKKAFDTFLWRIRCQLLACLTLCKMQDSE